MFLHMADFGSLSGLCVYLHDSYDLGQARVVCGSVIVTTLHDKVERAAMSRFLQNIEVRHWASMTRDML